MPSLLAEDTSTVLGSELTADTSPERYVHSHDGVDDYTTTQYEPYVRITGFGIDYTDCDDVTFPGFRPMRDYLTRDAARYLVSERRWSNEGDSVDIVGQKNLIIIFVCFATIEECLLDEKSEDELRVARPFKALMSLMGIKHLPNGLDRTHMFLCGIQTAFVNSRSAVIRFHLENGDGSPPEPSDLPGLGRMLLDVMDRHIAFLRTKRPLARLRASMPFEELLRFRLGQVKSQLCNKNGVEQCFRTFVPTISAHQQTSWPRAGMATSWEAAQAKLIAEQSELAVDSKPIKHPEYHQPTESAVPRDAGGPSGINPGFSIPGIPADGPVRSLQSAPNSPAGRPDTGHTDALSGLRIFKTAVRQVHRAIKGSRDSMDFRNFIGQIEHEVKQFHAELQAGQDPPTAGPTGVTGILGAELDVLLERQHIRSLMKVGLCLIREQWNLQYLTNDFRQKILVDIQEELRMIEDAANRVCSDEA